MQNSAVIKLSSVENMSFFQKEISEGSYLSSYEECLLLSNTGLTGLFAFVRPLKYQVKVLSSPPIINSSALRFFSKHEITTFKSAGFTCLFFLVLAAHWHVRPVADVQHPP
jgi:hypothetical protein